MRTFIIMTLLLGLSTLGMAQDEKPEVIKIGDSAPHFKLTTLDGKNFNTKDYAGKVIYLNFFATWCRPCMAEMPHIESEIWKQIKDEDFVMLSIGREHTNEELLAFRDKKEFTLPFGADPDRSIYSMYAPQMIPRNIVIDKQGKIVYSKHGFEQEEFQGMIQLIKTEINK